MDEANNRIEQLESELPAWKVNTKQLEDQIKLSSNSNMKRMNRIKQMMII